MSSHEGNRNHTVSDVLVDQQDLCGWHISPTCWPGEKGRARSKNKGQAGLKKQYERLGRPCLYEASMESVCHSFSRVEESMNLRVNPHTKTQIFHRNTYSLWISCPKTVLLLPCGVVELKTRPSTDSSTRKFCSWLSFVEAGVVLTNQLLGPGGVVKF